MGKTHYAAGAMFTAVLAPPISERLHLGLTPAQLAIGVGIGTFAGVLPDIDHPDSMITHGLIPGTRKLGLIGKALGTFLSIPPRVIGVGARATMNHRGGTHSLAFAFLWAVLAAPMYALVLFGLAALLAPLVALIASPIQSATGVSVAFSASAVGHWLIHNVPKIAPLVMLCVGLGYLSHLWADGCTNVPIPLPWPFSKRRCFLLPKPFRITTDSATERGLVRPLIIIIALAAFVWNIGIPLADQIIHHGQAVIHQIHH